MFRSCQNTVSGTVLEDLPTDFGKKVDCLDPEIETGQRLGESGLTDILLE